MKALVRIRALVAVVSLGLLLIGYQNCSSGFTLDPNGAFNSFSGKYGSRSSSSTSAVPNFTTDSALRQYRSLIIPNGQNNFHYANYPSIIKAGDGFHMFMCSAPEDIAEPTPEMDSIRYAHSRDGVTWSPPSIVLSRSERLVLEGGRYQWREKGTCDPSVARADLGDGEHYYMIYTGADIDQGTLMFIARSERINGPYLKLTQRGTWEHQPGDPKVILKSLRPVSEEWKRENGVYYYGAGGPTMLAKDGQLLVWYSDENTEFPQRQRNKIMHVTTANGRDWSAPTEVGSLIDQSSMDIKWNPQKNKFQFFTIDGGIGPNTSLVVRESSDPYNFGEQRVICDSNCFPRFAGNMGISADEQGHMVHSGAVLVAFGVPREFAPHHALMREMVAGVLVDPRDLEGQLRIPNPSDQHPVQRSQATTIRSTFDGRCAEVHHESYLTPGTWIANTPCADQFTKKFQFSHRGQGFYQILTSYGALCLAPQAAGMVEIQACGAPLVSSQLWRIQRSGSGLVFINKLNNLCLTSGSSFSTVSACNGSSTQSFEVPGISAEALVQSNTVAVQGPSPFNGASALDALPGWGPNQAIDGNPATVYSSESFASSAISRQARLHAYWTDGQRTVSRIYLRARMLNGRAVAFPQRYKIFVARSDESGWDLVAETSWQPGVDGQVQVPIQPRRTFGVLIIPESLGQDNQGSYYFQMADVWAE